MASVYEQVYARSMRDPEGFWAEAAEDIYWERRWDKVFDDSRKPLPTSGKSSAIDPI